MLYHAGPSSSVFFAECLKIITDSNLHIQSYKIFKCSLSRSYINYGELHCDSVNSSLCYPLLLRVTPCYPVFPCLPLCYPVFPVLPCVTLCYPMLICVTLCYPVLSYVTLCYLVLPHVTLCYPM